MPDATPGPVAGGFTVAADGSWTYEGALTFENAAEVLGRSRELPLPKGGRIDVGGLNSADSSALAVLLALKRRGAGERHKVHVVNLPDSLVSLGRVYGIDDIVAG